MRTGPADKIPDPKRQTPAALRRRGQAMTEVVLLFPIFMVIVFITVKMFALLVLVQKMEIASYYAARRWQLESHINAEVIKDSDGEKDLQEDIKKEVQGYIGYDTPSVARFLDLTEDGPTLDIVPTQVWNVVTLGVKTKGSGITRLMCKTPAAIVCAAPYGKACQDGYTYICKGGGLTVIKYVPHRDRPIKFVLPGIQQD